MPTKWLRVIPTPHFFAQGKRLLPLVERGRGRLSLQVGADPMVKLAAEHFRKEINNLTGLSDSFWAAGDLGVPLLLGSIQEANLGPQLKSRLDAEDLNLLQNDTTSQAYVLRVATATSPGAIVVAGAAPQGALYGVMTLLQLLRHRAGSLSVPEVHIRDYPDFKHRAAADWLLFCEVSRWAYDWGDGKQAYVDRVKRKLDFCLHYKINMVYFDGFGWNPERFPGYAEMMRDLNRFARHRGIRLVFGGYGMGYAASTLGPDAAYGPTFQNRRTYPEGEIYQCMGWKQRPRSREAGTCLSNHTLEQLKLENLTQFVQAVHPGALYIHHLDATTYSAAQEIWASRCQECRQRWPNDSYKEKDGAVAAFAHWYDQVCQAVFTVEDDDYLASGDCTVILVSPCYTAYQESDQDWDNAIEFWTKVSNLMSHNGNVQVGLREQFLRYDNNRRRIEEMAAALKNNGSGLGIHLIAFGGADRFRNDHLFVATPVMNGIYQGAEALYNCCGHVHQEPLQMLNAQYCWNARPGFQDIPDNGHLAPGRFLAYRDGDLRPAPIFGERGFLEESCRRLYGDKAAKRLRRVFDLRSAERLTPVAVAFGSIDDSLPGKVRDLTAETAQQLRDQWQGRLDVTNTALTEVKAALKAEDLPAGAAQDLDWLRKGLETGFRFAEILRDLYASLALPSEGRPLPRAFSPRIGKKLQRLDHFLQQAFGKETVCPLGADVQVWWECLEALKQAVAKPPASLLETPSPPHQWW